MYVSNPWFRGPKSKSPGCQNPRFDTFGSQIQSFEAQRPPNPASEPHGSQIKGFETQIAKIRGPKFQNPKSQIQGFEAQKGLKFKVSRPKYGHSQNVSGGGGQKCKRPIYFSKDWHMSSIGPVELWRRAPYVVLIFLIGAKG